MLAPSKTNPYFLTASGLLRSLDRLREMHPDMTVLQAMTFFWVAQNPGSTQRLLPEAIGASDSVTARTLAILTKVGGRNVPPLDLVVSTVHPTDRRERILDLTPKGRDVMDDILRDLSKP